MNWKINSIKPQPLFLLGGFLFLFLSIYLLLYQGSFYAAFAGVICLLSLGYFLSLSDLKTTYCVLAFLLPFSIKLNFDSVGFDFSFPSEFLIALLAIALVFRWIFDGYSAKRFLTSSISQLVLLYLLISLISAAFSTMPQVSLKSVVVRITYVLVFYFGLGDVFHKEPNKVFKLFLTYGFSLILITLYCLYFQSLYDWDKQTAAYSVSPFYADHTIFSACVAFVLPSFFSYSFQYKKFNTSFFSWKWALVLVFLLGIYFTFCRAAWISLFLAFLLILSIKIGFKPKHYLLLLLVLVSITFVNKDELFFSFKQNKNVSTAPNTTAIEQTQSITNVSTDVSNAERLNRWSCAWRMFLAKPFTGFGPGTFQFQYLPYQLPDETTYISVYSPYNIQQGRGGSTHNEYLLLLSESGIIAFLCFVILILKLLYDTLSNLTSSKIDLTKKTIYWAFIGLFTYLVHAFFNNFLDTDKAAFLFWSAVSILVSWNLSNKKTASEN